MAFISDHERLDARSLALHQLIAAKLAENPELLDVARSNLERWLGENAGAVPALLEWQRILQQPLDKITAILTDPSEDATRLRQSSPFAGVLTEEERLAIYESFATRAHHPGRQRDLG